MGGPGAPRVSPPGEADLGAGSLSATLVGPDLLDVRWGSLEVASRIQVTVRDREWGTVPPRLRSCSIERSANGFRVDLSAVHDDGRVGFAWRGRIEGSSDGELTFSIDGIAEREFEYRRIGICVLHPWRAYVGSTYRATTPSKEVYGTFPRKIAPQMLRDGQYQPMIEAFSALHVDYPGAAGVAFEFQGELFELEDQRNWTDASFKTYPTPLALSEPRWDRPGERVAQRVRVRMEGVPPHPLPAEEVTAVRIMAPTGRRMPPIGLVTPGDPALHPAHLRVNVDVASGDVAELGSASSLSVPLEVALLVDDEGRGIEAIAPALAAAPLARCLIHRSDGGTIPGALVRSLTQRLGPIPEHVPIVGGTSDYFSELNRHPPDRMAVGAIAFSISPTVHASDERSMIETLEIQGEVLRQASELAEGLPIAVSPIRLGVHAGTSFANAWTIGSVTALAAAGAASLTYETGTSALTYAMELHDAELLDVVVSRPERIAVLGSGRGVVLANLTPQPQRSTIDGEEQPALMPYEVRIR